MLNTTDTAAVSKALGKPEIRAPILLAVVAFHAPLLMGLSSRQRRSGHPVLRSLLWGVSAVYFPLMTYVLSYLTTYIPSASQGMAVLVLVLVILVQFIRAKGDMAAMAVAAVASPAAGDNDVNSLKIRPSTESIINTFWVAGLVTYNVYKILSVPPSTEGDALAQVLYSVGALLMSPLWVLGACRTVLRFAAFQTATVSLALGRNVQLIDGYMLQLLEEEGEGEGGSLPVPGQIPRLIVTGERDQDVVESPVGYRVKRSSLQGERRRLVTLDLVWAASDRLLVQKHKDLCLSFALFKCLRRRFAGYRLAAEAGSSWAFRFVCDGLLRPEDDHELVHVRMFRVIATELSFASDFFHSPLPVASLGTTAAALYFLFSLVILPSFLLVALVFLALILESSPKADDSFPFVLLALVLALFNAGTEISEMVDSVRSNWTKISMIGHFVRSRNRCARRFLACLLKCKPRKFWKDEIRQVQLLPWARRCCFSRFAAGRLLCLLLRAEQRNQHKDRVKVPPVVKEAILKSLRSGGGQLSDGTSAIRRHCHAFALDNDITWACRDGGDVLTTTDAILVWHIATTLFDIKSSSSSSPSPSTPRSSPSPVASSDRKIVACSLSRYCTYLVAEAPDLLPDKPAWIKRRYEAVKRSIEEASSKRTGDVPHDDSSSVYQHLVDTFCGDSSGCHEVLNKGSRLGKQLVDEAERRQSLQGGGAQDEVWELLSDFWSEMVLYLAPSDNVKVHIEALQRGGELITLLWALLLHAGITSRPVEFNFTASVLLATGDQDAIAVHNC